MVRANSKKIPAWQDVHGRVEKTLDRRRVRIRRTNNARRTPVSKIWRNRPENLHMGRNKVVLSTSRPNKTYFGRPLPSGYSQTDIAVFAIVSLVFAATSVNFASVCPHRKIIYFQTHKCRLCFIYK